MVMPLFLPPALSEVTTETTIGIVVIRPMR